MTYVQAAGFEVDIPDWLIRTLTAILEHGFYWVLPIALFFEIKYLCSRQRFLQIGMLGWGEATRDGQPVLFVFLWGLHILATVFFSWVFVLLT